MIDFDEIEWVSFDCYGTLVDWETGISAAVGEVLEARGITNPGRKSWRSTRQSSRGYRTPGPSSSIAASCAG